MDIFQAQATGDRNIQEDFVHYSRFDHYRLLVVADGLGGHDGGDIASRTLVEIIVDQLDDIGLLTPSNARSRLREWFDACVAIFQARLHASNKPLDAHTTVALALVDEHHLYALTVGDSRVYHVHEQQLWRTRDHSVVQMLVDDGEIAESEMGSHPEQGKLYQSVGPIKQVKARVEVRPLTEGDLVLVASDGFWEGVSADEIRMFADEPSQSALDSLVALACRNRAPKADNTTAVALVFQSQVTANGVGQTSTPEIDSPDRDNLKKTEHKRVTNRRRDWTILLAVLLFVVLVIWWSGVESGSKDAGAEAPDPGPQLGCVMDDVYIGQRNTVRIAITSLDDGSERVVTLPLETGKYQVRISDSLGKCPAIGGNQENDNLNRKRKFKGRFTAQALNITGSL